MKHFLPPLLLLLAAGSAHADGGLFIPATGVARATHHIETLEPYPDYVFVIEKSGFKPEAEFAELAPSKPLVIALTYPQFESPVAYPDQVLFVAVNSFGSTQCEQTESVRIACQCGPSTRAAGRAGGGHPKSLSLRANDHAAKCNPPARAERADRSRYLFNERPASASA